MLERIRKMQDEDGFTLIELMVVVLIIAILIAIAIPTFLGLRQRAQDRSSQSDARNGLTAGKAFYTDNETYTAFDAAAGALVEPALAWVDGEPAAGEVGVIQAAADDVLLAAESESGNTFYLGDNDGTTAYCNFDDDGAQLTVAACLAAGGTSPGAGW